MFVFLNGSSGTRFRGSFDYSGKTTKLLLSTVFYLLCMKDAFACAAVLLIFGHHVPFALTTIMLSLIKAEASLTFGRSFDRDLLR